MALMLAGAASGAAGTRGGSTLGLAVQNPCQATSPLSASPAALAHPAGQHAQGPLVQVHDGVVLPLVVVDLLRPE